ncbi:hypothetical protein ACGF7U_16840 [Micromonospora sp. NPDC047670]|uniref:hypothetical protein n=1 Tax=Micromonospora sp. NPDC047670 TaxID=3364252 RepID=UPI00371720FA
MIVVQMLGVRCAADGADPALLGQELLELLLADAVAPPQVVLATAAVEPLLGLPSPEVVARLAIGGVARTVGAVTRRIGHGLDAFTVGTEAMTVRNRPGRFHLTVVPLLHPLRTARPGASVEARLAVAAATAGTLAARAELIERLRVSAVAATTSTILIIKRNRHVRFGLI